MSRSGVGNKLLEKLLIGGTRRRKNWGAYHTIFDAPYAILKKKKDCQPETRSSPFSSSHWRIVPLVRRRV